MTTGISITIKAGPAGLIILAEQLDCDCDDCTHNVDEKSRAQVQQAGRLILEALQKVALELPELLGRPELSATTIRVPGLSGSTPPASGLN